MILRQLSLLDEVQLARERLLKATVALPRNVLKATVALARERLLKAKLALPHNWGLTALAALFACMLP